MVLSSASWISDHQSWFQAFFCSNQTRPSCPCPPDNMEPQAGQNVPSAPGATSPPLFQKLLLLTWLKFSEVFWQMYIHSERPGLLPMNSSQGLTPTTHTFRTHIFFSLHVGQLLFPAKFHLHSNCGTDLWILCSILSAAPSPVSLWTCQP